MPDTLNYRKALKDEIPCAKCRFVSCYDPTALGETINQGGYGIRAVYRCQNLGDYRVGAKMTCNNALAKKEVV